MARAEGDASVDVTEASATSGQAAPMAEAPANPTEAQEASQGTQDGPSDEAIRLAREDAEWRLANPNKPRMREANPVSGGESFDYLSPGSEGTHPDNAPAVPPSEV